MEELQTIYSSYKPQLQSIAYRMLGSLADAEDIVQEVFVSMQHVPIEDVRHIKAYLVKMVTNRCINFLKSAYKQREVYIGPWLPEPDIQAAGTNLTPEDRLVYDETISYAFMVMLQQLSPVERAVFLLREVLDYDYKEIAGMLDKSETNCRKIYSRVKPKIEQRPKALPYENEPTDQSHMHSNAFVNLFLNASRSGNFEPFIQLLVEKATLVTDGGGKVRAAIFPIIGRTRIQAFLEGICGKGSFAGDLRGVLINGDPGVLLLRDGIARLAICFGTENTSLESIEAVYFISNPDKLKRVRFN